MPYYDYRCNDCGHEFEAEQRITADALKECPNCHKPALERLISRTSFALKGAGWYKDAYSAPGQGKPKPDAKFGSSTSEAAKTNGDKISDASKK